MIEPSGVGKLSDVMKSVIDVEKDEDVKLNGLITVVNALKASKQMKAFGEFFNNQIESADNGCIKQKPEGNTGAVRAVCKTDPGIKSESCCYHNSMG